MPDKFLTRQMHVRTSSRVRSLLVLTGIWLLLALLSFPSAARADETPSPPPTAVGSNAVGACLDAEQVWLFVVDIDGNVLANQCVGTPSSGEQALADGGMQMKFSDGRLICSLSGHPEQCPATFTGSYWNYHHASSGEPFTMSMVGAAERSPAPGDIEAWCYNAPEDESCEPPLLTIVSGDNQVLVPGAESSDYVDPDVTNNPAVPVPATTPWALIGTVAVIVVGGAAFLWWRRRSGPADDQVGGR